MYIDFVIYLVLAFVIILLVFILFYNKKEIKTKEQKIKEIMRDFENRMEKTLTPLKSNKEEYTKQKIILLQTFAKELEFNIFFDKNEIRHYMKILANMDF